MSTETDLLASVAPQADPLTELVGDGKKFKDVSALAKAKVESDKFIEQLQAENAQMRKELGGATGAGNQEQAIQTLIELIEKATAAKNPDNQGATLSKEEIDKLVKDGITAFQGEATLRANYVKSNAELLNHFKGDAATAQTHLKERASALGLSGEELTKLASSNPTVFKALFIPTPKTSGPGPQLPPGKTGALPEPGEGGERGKSYYAKLLKDLGAKEFYSPAIQQQLFRDRKTLGDKYNTI